MKKSINLAFGTKRVDKVFKKALAFSVAAFIIVVLLSLGLITYRLIINNNFQNLEAREQQLNQQLLSFTEKRDKYIEIKSRLSEAQNITSRRAATIVRLNTMDEFVPFTATVNSLSGDEEEMSINLESEDLASLNELIEQTLVDLAEDRQKGIKKVDMNSFGLNPRSRLYSARFTVTFD